MKPLPEQQVDQEPNRRGNAAVITILVLVLLATSVFLVRNPEQIRIHQIQVPVGVSIRSSGVGIGNVLQIRNTSGQTLYNVEVVASNAAAATSASYRFVSIEPGVTQEIGWLEWDWKIQPNELIRISAEGFTSITFSSEQLGIR